MQTFHLHRFFKILRRWETPDSHFTCWETTGRGLTWNSSSSKTERKMKVYNCNYAYMFIVCSDMKFIFNLCSELKHLLDIWIISLGICFSDLIIKAFFSHNFKPEDKNNGSHYVMENEHRPEGISRKDTWKTRCIGRALASHTWGPGFCPQYHTQKMGEWMTQPWCHMAAVPQHHRVVVALGLGRADPKRAVAHLWTSSKLRERDLTGLMYTSHLIFFFFAVLGFELRASGLLNRYSTAW
jgi:hypothetical protein